jgi:putative Mg2+ transporter-C (MgtC) family protein
MLLHMAGALVLGWALGYERYFSGRAAGSQVYCLVCTTSCAVTLLAGYPSLWYWNTVHDASADPTHVVGAILTGIGFLGAGIIVKGGTNIRGLTTAASIWGSSAIGILVGVGFYVAATGLTALFLVSMILVPRFEHRLPARTAIMTTLRYRENHRPQTEAVHRFLEERGLNIVTDSLSISFDNQRFELRCVIIASAMRLTDTLTRMSEELPQLPHIESFTVSHYSRG